MNEKQKIIYNNHRLGGDPIYWAFKNAMGYWPVKNACSNVIRGYRWHGTDRDR